MQVLSDSNWIQLVSWYDLDEQDRAFFDYLDEKEKFDLRFFVCEGLAFDVFEF